MEHRGIIGALRPLCAGNHLSVDLRASVIEPQGCADIKAPLVITDVRSPESPSSVQRAEMLLCPVLIRHCIADHLPVDQIPGMGNGDAWKKDKAGIDHVIILSHPHNAGIRVHSPAYGIPVAVFIGETAYLLKEGLDLTDVSLCQRPLMGQIVRSYHLLVCPGRA